MCSGVESKCACMVNGIKCTDRWSLKMCDNRPLEGVIDDDDQNEDEIDSDENEDDDEFVIDFD